jgi:hypothetical protein
VYTHRDPEHSAQDLLARLRRVGQRWREAGLPGHPVVPLILDGENAWEHYADGGRVFLRRLYQGLQDDPELRAVTMGEAAGAPAGELPRVFAGSWIHADFSVWIGHEDDRTAWNALGEARAALGAHADAASPDGDSVRAWEAYRAACASDWWWWYGGDRSSDNDYEFDRLFRRYLQCVYVALGLPVPDALRATFMTTRAVGETVTAPTDGVRPVLDGRLTSEHEWAAAGHFRVGAVTTMGRAGHGLQGVRFGSGGEGLHLLLETSGPATELLARAELAVQFAGAAPLRYRVLNGDGGARLVREEHGGAGWNRAESQAAVAAAEVVELSIPLRELDPRPGVPLLFQVTLLEGGIELERHPEAAPVAVTLEEVPR